MDADQQTQNEAVEQALLRKATGYTYTQEDSYKLKTIDYDDKGKKLREAERVEVVQVEKQVQPEFSAIALWLKNRMPRRWGESAEECMPIPVQIIDDIPACTAQCAKQPTDLESPAQEKRASAGRKASGARVQQKRLHSTKAEQAVDPQEAAP